MRFWFSLLPLPRDVSSILESSCLEPWPKSRGNPAGNETLFIYDRPDRLIRAAAEKGSILNSSRLTDSYYELISCANASNQTMMAGWRLKRMGGQGLQQWLTGNQQPNFIGAAEPISGFIAAVILSMLEIEPRLLDAYTDVELQAELLDSEPELNYRKQLQHSIISDDPLPDLVKVLQNNENEELQTREELENARVELQFVQEELEALLFGNIERKKPHEDFKEKHKMVPPKSNVYALSLVEKLRSQLLAALDNSKEAEVHLRQLNQAQEELEHYFLLSQATLQLVEAQSSQLYRAKQIFENLGLFSSSDQEEAKPVEVEVVLYPDKTSKGESLQVQALLTSYAHTLARAHAILDKALRK